MSAIISKRTRKVKQPGWVKILHTLRQEMPVDKAWNIVKISQTLGLSLPNTRRYLRILTSAGLLLEAEKGMYKYYALPRKRPDRFRGLDKDRA